MGVNDLRGSKSGSLKWGFKSGIPWRSLRFVPSGGCQCDAVAFAFAQRRSMIALHRDTELPACSALFSSQSGLAVCLGRGGKPPSRSDVISACTAPQPQLPGLEKIARALQAARPVARDSSAVPHRLVAGVVLPCASVAGPHRTTIALSDPCIQRRQRGISRQIRRLQFARELWASWDESGCGSAVRSHSVIVVVLSCPSVLVACRATIPAPYLCIRCCNGVLLRQNRRLQFAQAENNGTCSRDRSRDRMQSTA